VARLRGKRWQADVLIDGVRKRPTFATQAEAEAYERAIESGFAPTTKVTLGPFVDEQFNRIWGDNKAIQSIHTNLRVLYRYIPADTALAAIDKHMCDRMITKMMNDGKSGGTINRKLAVLSKVLKRALFMDLITVMPTWKRPKEGKARDRVWEKADEHKADLFWKHAGLGEASALTRFLLHTGCRVGEAYKLSRKDVYGGFVTFRDTKNGSTRRIILTATAKTAWDDICKTTNADAPFGEYPRDTFRGHWERLRAHFNAEDDLNFVPHMLRHTCATRLALGGVDLQRIKLWMGHKSIQMTLRYSHLIPENLDVAAKALEAA
jgi:integrase